MEGFGPARSFGPQVAPDYDAVSVRSDEDDTVEFLHLRAGAGTALEFAIGTARIALPLARRGTPVDGIELSPAMVEQLRAKPGGHDLRVRIGGHVPVASGPHLRPRVLVYNTIGNLLTQDEQVRSFENTAARLAPNGVFALECRVPTAPSQAAHQFDAEHVGSTEWSWICAATTQSPRFSTSSTSVSTPMGSPCRRSVCAWPVPRSSIFWRGSRDSASSNASVAGTVSRSRLTAGDT